jgi:hypothetical protein
MQNKIVVSAPSVDEKSNLPLVLIFNNLMQLQHRVSKMDKAYFYTFQEIIGDEYWEMLTKNEQSLSFASMDFLIEHEKLPFELAGFLSNAEALYRLK